MNFTYLQVEHILFVYKNVVRHEYGKLSGFMYLHGFHVLSIT